MAEQIFHVLLIEDDLDDMFLVKEMLSESRSHKFRLTHAKTLAEGLALGKTEKIDIILTDLTLPDAHGMETFQSIQEHIGGKPTVVLSGNNDVDMAKEAVRLGAQDYLVKGEISEGLLSRALLYAVERKKMELTLIQSERLAGWARSPAAWRTSSTISTPSCWATWS